MKLFSCEDGFNLIIEPELFLLNTFKALYMDRKGKEALVIKELSYIYFMHEPSSDFQASRKEERAFEVKKHINLDLLWEEDEYVKDCVATFLEMEPITSGLLKDTYEMVNKIRDELKAINLSDKDKMGKPVYNLKQIIETSKQIPLLMETLNKAENEYVKGQAETNKNKGSKIKSAYEDM